MEPAKYVYFLVLFLVSVIKCQSPRRHVAKLFFRVFGLSRICGPDCRHPSSCEPRVPGWVTQGLFPRVVRFDSDVADVLALMLQE